MVPLIYEENLNYCYFPPSLLGVGNFSNLVSPSERISDADKKPVGDFHFFNNQWILINRNLPDMMDVTEKKTVAIGEYVPLTEGRQILLDKGQGGRLVVVQLVNN